MENISLFASGEQIWFSAWSGAIMLLADGNDKPVIGATASESLVLKRGSLA